jgi:hypothetical protein
VLAAQVGGTDRQRRARRRLPGASLWPAQAVWVGTLPPGSDTLRRAQFAQSPNNGDAGQFEFCLPISGLPSYPSGDTRPRHADGVQPSARPRSGAEGPPSPGRSVPDVAAVTDFFVTPLGSAS